MPPTLIGLAFVDGHRPHRVPFAEYYDLTSSSHVLKDWKILVQGPHVVLVSPPGWKPLHGPVVGKVPADAPCTLIPIARIRVQLYWSGVAGDVGALDGQWPAAAKPDGKGKA